MDGQENDRMHTSQTHEGFTGGCLCGAVRFESRAKPNVIVHCYCVDCRKTSGTGHCTHVVVPFDAFRVTGDVRFYDRPTDRGNVVSRGFCAKCGSPVYSKNSGMPHLAFPRASVLDDPEVEGRHMVVYASRAPSWDATDLNVPTFDEGA